MRPAAFPNTDCRLPTAAAREGGGRGREGRNPLGGFPALAFGGLGQLPFLFFLRSALAFHLHGLPLCAGLGFRLLAGQGGGLSRFAAMPLLIPELLPPRRLLLAAALLLPCRVFGFPRAGGRSAVFRPFHRFLAFRCLGNAMHGGEKIERIDFRSGKKSLRFMPSVPVLPHLVFLPSFMFFPRSHNCRDPCFRTWGSIVYSHRSSIPGQVFNDFFRH